MRKALRQRSKHSVMSSDAIDEARLFTNKVETVTSVSNSCSICLQEVGTNGDGEEVCELKSCLHQFHLNCFASYLEFASNKRFCPVCRKYFAFPRGDMPPGSMAVTLVKHFKCAEFLGYKRSDGTIQIIYSFPDGIQGPTHIRPGRKFTGTVRFAYLPNVPEGRKVLALLRKAFSCRLTFTVSDSVTTGRKDRVVWNNIHHKTNPIGGISSFGYPDEDYFSRVEEELRANGITEDMVDLTDIPLESYEEITDVPRKIRRATRKSKRIASKKVATSTKVNTASNH